MKAYFGYASVKATRPFECRSCAHRAIVEVEGRGEGGANSLNFDPEDTARDRAGRDAEKDVDRTLAVLRCPRCGFRDSSRVSAWWTAHAGGLVLAFVICSFIGWIPFLFQLNMREKERLVVGCIMTGVGAFTGLLMFLIWALPKWRSIPARVRWLEAPPSPPPAARTGDPAQAWDRSSPSSSPSSSPIQIIPCPACGARVVPKITGECPSCGQALSRS